MYFNASGAICKYGLARLELRRGPQGDKPLVRVHDRLHPVDAVVRGLVGEDGAHERDPHGGQAAVRMIVHEVGCSFVQGHLRSSRCGGPTAGLHDYMAKRGHFEENDEDAPEIQELKV
ncbi:hypothetical protein PRNP1_002030 [Phytophthora ramorum]